MAILPSLGNTDIETEATCCADFCTDNDESPDDCDVCNPFLSCSCYCGFIIPSDTFKLEKNFSFISGFSPFSLISPESLAYSFWQPPKLIA